MKKTLQFLTLGFMLLLLNACTKEETIIQEYNPPQPTLYGTWKQILNPNENYTRHVVIQNDNSNVLFLLFEDQYGFRNRDWYAYKATDKQIQYGSLMYNYKVKNDTLSMEYSNYDKMQFTRVLNPVFTPEEWVSKFSISRKVAAPGSTAFTEMLPFGIDGDFLYINGYNNQSNDHIVYKFNTLTGVLLDSALLGYKSAATYIKSGTVYYGFNESSNYIKKSAGGSMDPSINVSTNTLNAVNALSMNLSTGTIFAYSYGKMFAGSDGSNFSELYDFGKYGIYTVQYYKDDQFICYRNGRICIVKISPSFSIVAQYDMLPGINLNAISTNGSDIWGFGYDQGMAKNMFFKINLN